MINLIHSLPDLDETLLANLLTNAQRLARDGDEKQRASAADMLIAVEAERAKRAKSAPKPKPASATRQTRLRRGSSRT